MSCVWFDVSIYRSKSVVNICELNTSTADVEFSLFVEKITLTVIFNSWITITSFQETFLNHYQNSKKLWSTWIKKRFLSNTCRVQTSFNKFWSSWSGQPFKGEWHNKVYLKFYPVLIMVHEPSINNSKDNPHLSKW